MYGGMQAAEYVNRGIAFLGALSKAEAKGYTEAQAEKYAEAIVAKTQFSYTRDSAIRGMLMLPHFMRNFTTYPLKQGEFVRQLLGEAKRDREGKFKLLRFSIVAVLMSRLLGEAAAQFAPGPSRVVTEMQRLLSILGNVQKGKLSGLAALYKFAKDTLVRYIPGSVGVRNVAKLLREDGSKDDARDARQERFLRLKEERRKKLLKLREDREKRLRSRRKAS
jgi:hypothetical protein